MAYEDTCSIGSFLSFFSAEDRRWVREEIELSSIGTEGYRRNLEACSYLRLRPFPGLGRRKRRPRRRAA